MSNSSKLDKRRTRYKNRKIKSFETIDEIKNNPKKFNDYYDKISNLIDNIPYGFRENLRYLRVELGFSRELLEERTGISSNTIKEIETNKKRGYSLETVVALCVGMNLPPDFSFELLRKAGYDIENSSNQLNCLYKFILRNLYNKKIEEVNLFLQTNKKPSLTRKM